MKNDPRQYALDFSSPSAEALAATRGLPPHLTNLPADMAAGVADLLERIALCSRDRTTSHARATKLAAGLWLETTTRTIFDREKLVMEIQASSRDITERKESRVALQHAHIDLQ